MRSGFLSAENNETFYSFDWQNENTPSAQLFVWSTIEWIIRQQECRKNATQQKEEKGDNVVKPTISLSYRNNVSGKSSDTWPLYSKGQHLRYNGENMSLFFFVSAQMNARKKIVDAILFCYLVEWAKNYALGWHGYPMFMFRMFQATAKKSDSSFAFFLVVNRVFHHSNRILIHSHNDILFQSFTQTEYHWLYAIRNDFYDFYKYHVS